MKTRYYLIAIAALASFACSKDLQRDSRIITVTAWQEDASGSKSAIADGGTQVYWEPEDAIKLFYDKVGSKFESQCKGLTKVTDFTGSLGFVGGGTEDASPDRYIWGLYPYRLDATSDGNSVTTTLPSNQNGAAGSFAQNTNITLARSESFGLAFFNVCGGLRFSLTQSGIKRVILEGNDGEALAGTFTAGFENGVPVVKAISDPVTSITLKAPGDEFQTGVWYYIVALPGSLSKGFKLTFRSESGTGSVSSSAPVTIKRGCFGSLANADAGVEFSSGGDNPENVKIEIDGEFWDWADVPAGLSSSSGPYLEFKAFYDANYIYLYSKRNWNDGLWKDASGGYYYYELDTDNNPSTGTNNVNGNTGYGVEYWFYLYLFTGTSANPTFATNPKGDAYPSNSVIKNILAAGATDRSVIEVELRVPRADLGLTNPGTIRIYSWGNKSASNLKSASSYLTLTIQ